MSISIVFGVQRLAEAATNSENDALHGFKVDQHPGRIWCVARHAVSNEKYGRTYDRRIGLLNDLVAPLSTDRSHSRRRREIPTTAQLPVVESQQNQLGIGGEWQQNRLTDELNVVCCVSCTVLRISWIHTWVFIDIFTVNVYSHHRRHNLLGSQIWLPLRHAHNHPKFSSE